ncbi:tripartite motif-containing protein 55 [Patella vulgata]|uniref:tripartite motif-containing protein 55 n=1 Tax=Patella vulgata TaxID=6465 RepID=UPI0021808118|nr:tripartite motif-containing protein 55 [Patella vulgata]XP_050416591.1 tripartite motif-containing protein 55 [Patella vulgata]
MATDSNDIATDSASRNLIVDEASFEEQFLRCQVCREKFDREERTPKSLPCNHTFCQPCLKQVFDHSQPSSRRERSTWGDENRDGTLKCPTCRVEIYLSRSEIKKLPSDHRVIQMIDFLSQAVSKSQNSCSKHERQPINFFCKTCLVPVCRDCTVLDHKEQQGHVIVDVTDALTESSEEFNTVENKSRQLLDKMKQRADGLGNGLKRLDMLERQIKNEIKDTFIEYRLLLERRQDSQINCLKEMIKAQKDKMTKTFDDLNDKGTELQKLYDSFKQARTTNDVRQLFTINEKVKQKEESFKSEADAKDNALFVSYKFDVESEGVFLAEMSGLGEVTPYEDPGLSEPVPHHQLILFDMEEQQEQERRTARDMPLDCTYSGLPSGLTDLSVEDESLNQPEDEEGFTYHPYLDATRLTRLIESEYPHFNEGDSSEESPTDSQERRGRRSESYANFLSRDAPSELRSRNRRSRRPARETALPQGLLAPHAPSRDDSRSGASRGSRSSSTGSGNGTGSRSSSSRIPDFTTTLQLLQARVTQDESRS